MAICGRCNAEGDDKFYPSVLSNRGKNGLWNGGWCIACHREYYQNRVRDDREYFLRYQRKRIRTTAALLRSIKEVAGCERCGEKHPACLDFHHRDESTKLFNISLAGSRGKKTVEQMQTEIDKCAVLCSNCHRKLHWDDASGVHSGKPSRRDPKRNGWDGL